MDQLPSELNVLRGQVAVASFLGVAIQYQVTTAGGEELTVIAQNRNSSGPAQPEIGQDVFLTWDPRHTIVVASEQVAAAAAAGKEETDG